jgi:hypothetical protein
MRRGVWVKTASFGVVFLLMFGLAGCWNPFGPERDPNGGDPKIDRKSPDRLLEFFATVYEDKDLDRYEESLDDDYTFTFMQDDFEEAGVSAERPYWSKWEDVPRTNMMFTAAKTKNIAMDLSIRETIWIAVTEYINIDGTPTPVDGFFCRIKPVIDVTIEGGTGEEPVIKQVRKSHIDVTVIPDRHIAGLWTILKIIESPIVG